MRRSGAIGYAGHDPGHRREPRLIRGAADSASRPPPPPPIPSPDPPPCRPRICMALALAFPSRTRATEISRRPQHRDCTSARSVNAYLNAFARLDGHEIAAMTLTLGNALLRGDHRHRAGADRTPACRPPIADARGQTIAGRAEVDRV